MLSSCDMVLFLHNLGLAVGLCPCEHLYASIAGGTVCCSPHPDKYLSAPMFFPFGITDTFFASSPSICQSV